MTDSAGNPAALPVGSTPGGAGIEVLFAFVVGSSTATITDDFSFNQNSVVFQEGQTTADLTVDILEDLEIDPDETVTIRLTGIQFVQTADDAIVPGLLNGEEICFEDSEHSLTIIDNDFAVPPAVTGIFANGTAWNSLFRDRIDDGLENGTEFGYEITSPTETLPWVNVDQLIVHFDMPVDSVSASDFSLTGTPGVTVVGGMNFDGLIPNIVNATAVGNTVVLDLAHSLQPAILNLAVNASGLTFGGVAGVDSNISFNALPGDVANDSNTVTLPSDVVDLLGRLNAQITPGGGTSGPYTFRADLNGSNVINVGDLGGANGALNLIGDQLVPPSSSSSIFFASSNESIDKLNDEKQPAPTSITSSSSQNLDLAGSISNDVSDGSEVLVSSSISEDVKEERTSSKGDKGGRFAAIDNAFESEFK